MKKILFILSMFIGASSLFAQAPQGINYQGVARNNIGAAISNAPITVQFQIHQGSAGGTVVFNETQNTTTDTFGLYSLVIGQGGGLSSVNWSGGQMFLQIIVNGTAVATTQLQSVPYALYSGGSSTGVTSVTGNPAQIVATGTTNVSLDLATLSPSPSGIYGSSSTVPQITVDQYGRVTGVVNMAIPSPATQSLSLSGNTLGISGGNTVTLPTPTSTVVANTPLSGDGSSSLPLTISTASNTTNGYLTSGDWNTFNNKVSSISFGSGITGTAINNSYTISAINTASSLPTPTVGSLLYANPTNVWAATNPSNISSDGNSITVINTATVTAATFSSSATSGSNPVLQVISNTSQGYAIQATNLSGAAIVANSNGPYAIEGNISGGSGNGLDGEIANSSFGNGVAGYIQTGSGGNAVYGNVDNASTGKAGSFSNSNLSNSDTTLLVLNMGTGYSGSFNGGKGLQTDLIKITGSPSTFTPTTGYVLTSSDAFGNAKWAPPTAQTLSLAANTLSISGGNSVALPPPGVANVTNGLTLTTGTVALGGLLTNTTTITQNTFPIMFNGNTGNVQITNSSAANALYVTNISTGSAITASNSGANTISAQNTGTVASSGIFQNTLATNSFPSLNVITSSTAAGPAIFAQASGGNGNAINASSTGTGSAGSFTVNNSTGSANALYATTNGSGSAINATNTGSGSAISASVPAGTGFPVINVTANGNSNGINVQSNNNSNAIVGTNAGTSGFAGAFTNSNPSSGSAALNAVNQGSGAAISANNAGSGPAIVASTAAGSPATVIQANATAGYSGKFNGGAGLQADNFQMTTTTGTVVVGSVLTASTTAGNAMWAAPISFAANSSTTSVPTGSVITVVFSNSEYNYGGGYSTSNGVFTAPVAGTYHFDAGVALTVTITPSFDYELQLQGPTGSRTSTIIVNPNGSYNFTNVVSGDFYLNAGATVKIAVYHNYVSTLQPVNGVNYCWFTGHLVR